MQRLSLSLRSQWATILRAAVFAAAIPATMMISAQTAGATPATLTCGPNADRVWLYDSPTTLNVVSHLKCGDSVEVIGRAPGYAKVRDSAGKEGFVPLAMLPDLPPAAEGSSEAAPHQLTLAEAAALARHHTTAAAAPPASAPAPAAPVAVAQVSTTPVAVAPAPVAVAPAPVAVAPAPVIVAKAEPAPAPRPVAVNTPAPAAKPAPQPAAEIVLSTAPDPEPAPAPAPAPTPKPVPVRVARASAPASTPAAKPVRAAAPVAPAPRPAPVAPAAASAPQQVAEIQLTTAPDPAPAPASVSRAAVAEHTPSVPKPDETISSSALASPAKPEYVSDPAAPIVHTKLKPSDDEDEDAAADDAAARADHPDCSAYFSAYGVSPNQYKYIVTNRKKYPGICPAPSPALVDFVVIFTHDVDFYNFTMPTAVHTDSSGLSNWTPMSMEDSALVPVKEMDKNRREYVWVFHTRRGAFDPARFSAKRHPLFEKAESNTFGSHAGDRTADAALHFIADNRPSN